MWLVSCPNLLALPDKQVQHYGFAGNAMQKLTRIMAACQRLDLPAQHHHSTVNPGLSVLLFGVHPYAACTRETCGCAGMWGACLRGSGVWLAAGLYGRTLATVLYALEGYGFPNLDTVVHWVYGVLGGWTGYVGCISQLPTYVP